VSKSHTSNDCTVVLLFCCFGHSDQLFLSFPWCYIEQATCSCCGHDRFTIVAIVTPA
jgi:hypothetical protein